MRAFIRLRYRLLTPRLLSEDNCNKMKRIWFIGLLCALLAFGEYPRMFFYLISIAISRVYPYELAFELDFPFLASQPSES